MVAEKFANFIAETKYETLPDEIVAAAKERILDTVGAAVAGSANWEYKENFLNACRSFGLGCWNVIGSHAREFPLPRAAMINSTFAHAIELDDGHKNAGVHAGASVVPTALTLGAGLGSTGRDIITAVTLGYDVVYRIASNMAPYQIEKGFHPSGNDDTIGAAAIAVLLAGMVVFYLGARPLFALFSQDPDVIEVGVHMMQVLVPAYVTYVCIEILSGALRGCGDVRIPTLITVVCVCGLRILWLVTVVPVWHSVATVEMSYPITWVLASLLFILYYKKGGWLTRCIAARHPAAE